ncbi:MAG: DUF3284 domain-containing protein [Lactobacillus sp.]|nr:DUF3284 domain-containing protein [Lactobacillus sp.]
MKISMKLNVSAEYLFQRLVDTVIYDVKQETGQELTVADLNGLSYATKLDRQTKADLSVIKVVPDQSYHIQVETDGYVKREAYELTALATDLVQVEYSEQSFAKRQVSKLKEFFFKPIAQSIRRRNFMKLLKEIEVGY